MRPPEYAVRTMRARRESVCPACGGPVMVGQRIGLVPGRGWLHVLPCIVGYRPPATITTTERTAP